MPLRIKLYNCIARAGFMVSRLMLRVDEWFPFGDHVNFRLKVRQSTSCSLRCLVKRSLSLSHYAFSNFCFLQGRMFTSPLIFKSLSYIYSIFHFVIKSAYHEPNIGATSIVCNPMYKHTVAYTNPLNHTRI